MACAARPSAACIALLQAAGELQRPSGSALGAWSSSGAHPNAAPRLTRLPASTRPLQETTRCAAQMDMHSPSRSTLRWATAAAAAADSTCRHACLLACCLPFRQPVLFCFAAPTIRLGTLPAV